MYSAIHDKADKDYKKCKATDLLNPEYVFEHL